MFRSLYYSCCISGKKAGYLAGAFYVGTFVSNPLWGWLSDTWGRRPVLLLGVCGCISAEILFGFSQNFGWAMGARTLWGILNGNMFRTTKVYVTEVSIYRLYCMGLQLRLQGLVVAQWSQLSSQTTGSLNQGCCIRLSILLHTISNQCLFEMRQNANKLGVVVFLWFRFVMMEKLKVHPFPIWCARTKYLPEIHKSQTIIVHSTKVFSVNLPWTQERLSVKNWVIFGSSNF